MDLWQLLVLVVVLGFVSWLVTLEQSPLPANFKWLISTACWILALVLVLWAVLSVLGIPAALKGTKVSSLRPPAVATAFAANAPPTTEPSTTTTSSTTSTTSP